MAWCHQIPKHCLNQRWLLLSEALLHLPWNNYILFSKITAITIWGVWVSHTQALSFLTFNTLGPRLKWTPFHRRYFQGHFPKWKSLHSIKILLKFVPNGPINNIPALLQIMSSSPTHICVTRLHWINVPVSTGIWSWMQWFVTVAHWRRQYGKTYITNWYKLIQYTAAVKITIRCLTMPLLLSMTLFVVVLLCNTHAEPHIIPP